MPRPCNGLAPEERADILRVRPQGALSISTVSIGRLMIKTKHGLRKRLRRYSLSFNALLMALTTWHGRIYSRLRMRNILSWTGVSKLRSGHTAPSYILP